MRISAALHESGKSWVGAGVTPKSWVPQPIAVTLGKKKPRCFLLVAYILGLDAEGTYLTVEKSTYGLYTDENLDRLILHYDYIRDPDHGYPGAHLQLNGESETLAELCGLAGVNKDLKKLHLPVGGTRFRPTLEDLVEFLIVEELIDDVREGADVAINDRREEWYRLQLRAAVRRDPQTAAEVLAELGSA